MSWPTHKTYEGTGCENCARLEKELEAARAEVERLKQSPTGWTRDHQELWSEMVRNIDKPEYAQLAKYAGHLEATIKDLRSQLEQALREARDNALEEAAKVFEFWERNRLHGSSTDHIKMQAFKECRLVLRDTKEFEYHLGQALDAKEEA